jgi:hypothetical protein
MLRDGGRELTRALSHNCFCGMAGVISGRNFLMERF